MGLGDLASPSLLGGKTSTSSSSRTTTSSSFSTAQYASLPDYQEFLTWLSSVSGPYKGKSLNITLEAEFGSYAAQLIDSDFANTTGIIDLYDIKPYSLQLEDVALMFSTKSNTYDVFSLDVENLGLFPGSSISPLELAQKYPDLTYPNIDFADFNQDCWDHIATYPARPFGRARRKHGKHGPGPPLRHSHVGSVLQEGHLQQARTHTSSDMGRAFLRTVRPYRALDWHRSGRRACAAPTSPSSTSTRHTSAASEDSLWEIDGNTIVPAMNNDQAIAALEDFVRFEPLSDVGSFYFTWDDVFNSVAHESGAQALLWNGYAEWMNDSQRSLVPGLIGYAALPAGPQGAFSPVRGVGTRRLPILEQPRDGLALGSVGDRQGHAGGHDPR